MLRTATTAFVLFISLALIGSNGVVRAQSQSHPNALASLTPSTVVELFTSQGCPACPAANAFAGTLLDDPSILVLSYSVDYWDYMGWKDTFSKPEFSKRQREYAHSFKGQVYTPQMVVNGREHAKRYTHEALRRKTQKAAGIDIRWDGNFGGLALDIENNSKTPDPFVLIVRYQEGVQYLPIHAGQNKDKTVPLVNLVTDCSAHKIVSGAPIMGIPVPKPGEAIAVLVHEKPGGPVIASSVYSNP